VSLKVICVTRRKFRRRIAYALCHRTLLKPLEQLSSKSDTGVSKLNGLVEVILVLDCIYVCRGAG
jgi:hypothetical protein